MSRKDPTHVAWMKSVAGIPLFRALHIFESACNRSDTMEVASHPKGAKSCRNSHDSGR